MTGSSRPTAAVVGGGVAGLLCAIRLSRRFSVTLIAPHGAQSASAVAAGMLAPAMEAALDPLAPPFPLLMAGLESWRGLEGELGLPPALACGSLWLGEDVEAVAAKLAACGASARPVDPAEVRRLQPGLDRAIRRAGVFAEEDARLEVGAVLAALAGFLAAAGVRRVDGLAARVEAGLIVLTGGARIAADVVVVAPGAGATGLVAEVPEFAGLTPIKGQLARFAAGPVGDGAMLRTVDGYLVPSAGGAVAGATMEAGRNDTEVDDAVLSHAAAARRWCPELAGVRFTGAAGVRMATADGRPLVGWSRSGVLVAAGFRRNGWLLAALAAEIVAALAEEGVPGAWAASLAPGRLVSSG